MSKYNAKSMKAEEFINDGEILATLKYAWKQGDGSFASEFVT